MRIISNLFRNTLFKNMGLKSNRLSHKVFIIGLVLLFSQKAFSTQSDYLRQLELEANMDDEIEQSSTVEANQNNNSEEELIWDKKQLVNNQKNFEKALKESFPESYALYEDMDEKQKKKIFKKF